MKFKRFFFSFKYYYFIFHLALEKLLIDKEFAIHKEKKTLQGYHINEHNFYVYIYTTQELKINK